MEITKIQIHTGFSIYWPTRDTLDSLTRVVNKQKTNPNEKNENTKNPITSWIQEL